MRDGPSVTAQRVAGFRLLTERLPGGGGRPEDDDALAHDVAAGCSPIQQERIRRHLEARTKFFDRVVVRALERGVTQFVLLGAGYDGRALRYGRPGTSWWEVDHPNTQADKLARLSRLGIETPHVTFVPFDLEEAGLGAALAARGFNTEAPTVICCEGVIPYLTRSAVERLLGECRAVASPGTRLAASVSLARGPDEAGARQALARATGELGEPLSEPLAPDELETLLAGTRWRLANISEQAQRAGLLVLGPVWGQAPPGMPDSAGALARFADRMLARPDDKTVATHLSATYGVEVRNVRAPDLGVLFVDLPGRRRWVARVQPKDRDGAVRAEASLLQALAATGFPCERLAADPAVSSLDDWPVLVTERAGGRSPGSRPDTFGLVGELLGRLHTMSPQLLPPLPDAGAWHHLVGNGTPADEIVALRALLEASSRRVRPGEADLFDAVVAHLDDADDGAGLPHTLVHADAVPSNLVRSADGAVTLVDWSGAGRGPRVVSLGCLLWAAAGNRRNLEAAAAAYRRWVALTTEELDRLEGAMVLRPVVLAGWTLATGRDHLPHVAERLALYRRQIRAAGPLARALLSEGRTEGRAE